MNNDDRASGKAPPQRIPKYQRLPIFSDAMEAVLAGSFEGSPTEQLRQTWPPRFSWPEDEQTRVAFIQPWEYPQIPLAVCRT